MRSLSDTIARLHTVSGRGVPGVQATGSGRLTPLDGFGTNPGALRGLAYLPDRLAADAALVVVLHGCTQTAAGYDLGAGWSEMADRHGFALLFPEQQRANNPNLCFNWFSAADNRAGAGEALSIRQMIAAMLARHPLDPARVFVTGLSAGGAMAGVMLATYPALFAGGAIIAGLPYGCADTIPQAFDRMRGHGGPAATALGDLVRDATDHAGPWPIVSVWHGSADAVVNPTNADAVTAQWRAVHGLAPAPTRVEAVDGYPRSVWCNADGRALVESYSITGMGHGTPLDTGAADGCGASGAYMLEAQISSTQHICRFWGLAGADARATGRATVVKTAAPAERLALRPNAGGVGQVIEDALRSAGLMR